MRLVTLPKSAWNLLKTLVWVGIVVLAFASVWGFVDDKLTETPHITVRPINLITEVVGRDNLELEFTNGVCNNSDVPITTRNYAFIQAIGHLNDQSTFLFGTVEEPVLLPVFPGCVGTNPVHFDLPEDTPSGVYTLTIVIDTVGNAEGVKDPIAVTSSQFRIVD